MDGHAPARTAQTDACGAYYLPDLRPGWYRVTVDSAGHPPSSTWMIQLEVRPGEETVRDFVVSDGVTRRGRVVDRDTGEPVAGAHVEDFRNPFNRIRADGDGRFVLRGMRRGAGVRITAPGYNAQCVPLGVAADRERTVRLVRGIVISGRVIGPDGEPVAGARVSAHVAFSEPREEETRTDESGAFRLTGLQEYASRAGNRIRVAADGFAPAAHRVLGLKAGDEKHGVEIRLAKGAALTGRVTDEHGSPVSEARVLLRSPPLPWFERYTDSAGRFAFTNVTPGTYDLHLVDRGFMQRHRFSSRQPTCVRGLILSSGDRRHEEIILRAGAVVAGRVTDTDGRPVPGAVVKAEFPFEVLQKGGTARFARRTTLTGEDGSFSIGGLLENAPEYLVWANRAGYRGARSRRVGAGTRGLSLTLTRLATVKGRVVMGATGRPAREFSVGMTEVGDPAEGRKLHHAGESVVDLAGRFTLHAPPGSYRISARTISGKKSRTVSITFGPEGVSGGIELTIEEGAVLSGTVLTPAGGPARRGSVAVYALDPTASRTRVAGASFDEGRFTVPALTPGRYWLRAASFDHPEWDATIEVEVRPGAENRADLQFTPGGRLSVYVKDEARRPVPGATVTVKRPDGMILPLQTGKYTKEKWKRILEEGPRAQRTFSPRFLETDDTGSIHPRYLPPGRYLVEVKAPGFATAQKPFRIAPAHLTAVAITLRRAN
jgi:protocatechuate 3,4-dioxygenase beta subunit